MKNNIKGTEYELMKEFTAEVNRRIACYPKHIADVNIPVTNPIIQPSERKFKTQPVSIKQKIQLFVLGSGAMYMTYQVLLAWLGG